MYIQVCEILQLPQGFWNCTSESVETQIPTKTRKLMKTKVVRTTGNEEREREREK